MQVQWNALGPLQPIAPNKILRCSVAKAGIGGTTGGCDCGRLMTLVQP